MVLWIGPIPGSPEEHLIAVLNDHIRGIEDLPAACRIVKDPFDGPVRRVWVLDVRSPHLAARIAHIEPIEVALGILIGIEGGNITGDTVGHLGVRQGVVGMFPDQGAIEKINHVDPPSHAVGAHHGVVILVGIVPPCEKDHHAVLDANPELSDGRGAPALSHL